MENFDFIQWDKNFMTGIDKIDDGHLQFTRIYNQLVDIIQKDMCNQKMLEIMYALIHYAEHHLINEEIYYQGYEGFAVHKNRHQEFIKRINEFQSHLTDRTDLTACKKLVVYLHEWFTEHILKQDKDAVEFVKNN